MVRILKTREEYGFLLIPPAEDANVNVDEEIEGDSENANSIDKDHKLGIKKTVIAS